MSNSTAELIKALSSLAEKVSSKEEQISDLKQDKIYKNTKEWINESFPKWKSASIYFATAPTSSFTGRAFSAHKPDVKCSSFVDKGMMHFGREYLNHSTPFQNDELMNIFSFFPGQEYLVMVEDEHSQFHMFSNINSKCYIIGLIQ
jgi:5'-3' exonuclease